ncbi:hypothetical protein RHSIM_Rhsim08G0158600 [Rhododendron simsii]|uniref:Uncharacterized protein n=1 Tax=Rhododendron simsii TaxID=118357 RepID=A0A834GHI0_RHOSS|nr:hypothetical protein RHSIM_Rhsim08G0158600 [Rhododendron simsii]
MRNVVVLIETTYDKVSSNWSIVSSKGEIMHGGGVVLNEEGYDTALQVVPPRTKKLIVRLANLVFKKAVVVAQYDTKKLLILQSEYERAAGVCASNVQLFEDG